MGDRVLLTHPNKMLRKRSREVDDLRQEGLGAIIEEALAVLYRHDTSGMAVIQIGVPLRIVVLNCMGGRPVTLFNPKIVELSGEITAVETCLSLPGQSLRVTRFSRVKVEHDRLHGKEVIDARDPTLAVALQHEIDHLNGVIPLDRMKKAIGIA